MASVIFIRHSIPQIDPALPAREWSLSPAGHDAAQRLSARLAGRNVGAVISSDEIKARQTAAALAAPRGLTVEVDNGLREHERQSVGFLGRERFEAGIAAVFAHPGTRAFGEESADDVFDRFSAAVQHAAMRRGESDGDIAVITHGTALCIFLSRHAGIDPLPFWKSMTLPMAVLLEDHAVTIL
ncbi:MAG: histidine phosphatase family protein [Devosia sp.]|uniref:histidine phosphatase family protein n=1 Tax=Devosia sp. TaxID=1871048 RepID=UPI0024C5154B|nr:histidine phosphatase family protein [Devosia sp.]UYN98908.1 MAG: histidine phosphatase family protein [Devosia sp.]